MDVRSLREEVREQNLALRAELVRQSQRITALEQANRGVSNSSNDTNTNGHTLVDFARLPTGEDSALSSCASAPPASGEKEPFLDSAVAPADKVLDMAQEATKDTPDVAEESEVYTFEESVWDAQLFVFSKFMGKADSVLIIIYAALNMVVQAVFAAVVFEISTESLTPGALREIAHWRLVEGHHVKWYDVLTNTSLTRRVCDDYNANMVAGPQQTNFRNYNDYLAYGNFSLGIQQGPCLCLLGLFLWGATVLVDLWQVEHFAFALTSLYLKSRAKTSQSAVEDSEKNCMNQISTPRFVLSILLIVVPRLGIDICLFFAGVRFLAFENTLSGLILNAVALSFVLSLDELLFLLLPRNTQTFLQNVEPVTKTVRGVTKPGSVDWRSVGMLCGCAGIVLYTWFGYLDPRVTNMTEAARLLCEGRVDFIYAEDSGTAFVSVADTAPKINLPSETYTASAVVTYTTLGLTGPALSDYVGKTSSDMYISESTSEVERRSKAPSRQVLDNLPCENQDTSAANARALFQKYFETLFPEVLPGSFCAGLGANMGCTDPASKSYARALCPVTCGCRTMSLYDREGCSLSCNKLVKDLQNQRSRHCTDVKFQDADSEVTRFFHNVFDSLVASGSLVVMPDGRGQLSSAAHDAFQELADYQYALNNNSRFYLASNVSMWASGERQVEGFFPSPCMLLPFYLNIFKKDLCSAGPGGNLGTAVGFCPVVCGYKACSSSSSPKHMVLDVPKLYQRMASKRAQNIYGFFQPVLRCGQEREVSAESEYYLIEQPGWGNGDFTLDLCSNSSSFNASVMATVEVGVVDLESSWSERLIGNCLANFSVHTKGRMRHILAFSGLSPSSTFPVRLSCHQDGQLSCGTTLNADTAGAANFRGRPSPERIFNLDVPIGRLVTLTACGEGQFLPQIDMYWYSREGLQQGGHLHSQDLVSSAACSGTSLTRQVKNIRAQGDWFHTVVVEGFGNSTGNFSLHAACSYPLLSCGDHVHGNRQELLGRGYKMRSSVEVYYHFISGNAAVNVSFDTCGGKGPTSRHGSGAILILTNMSLPSYSDACDGDFGFDRLNTTIQPNTEVELYMVIHHGQEGEYDLNVTCTF